MQAAKAANDDALEIGLADQLEEVIETEILGGRNIDHPDVADRQRAEAVAVYKLASGQVTPFAAFKAEWLSFNEHLKPKGRDQMARDLDRFAASGCTLEEVNFGYVVRWIDAFYAEGGTNSSIRRHLESLRSYWRYVSDRNLALREKSPPFENHRLRQSAKGKKKGYVPWQIHEALELLAAAQQQKRQDLASLITLAMYTGARIEELCKLRVEDVIVARNMRVFEIRQAKTEAGIRQVPIHPEIGDLVDHLIEQSRDGYLIPSTSKNQYGIRSDALSKRFGKLKRSVGFTERSHSFHSFRATVATLFEQAGVVEGVAADILGHEKPTITYGVYSGDSSLQQRRDAVMKIVYLPQL